MITSSSLWAPSTTPTFSTSLPVPMWAPTPPPPWDLENYCEETIVEKHRHLLRPTSFLPHNSSRKPTVVAELLKAAVQKRAFKSKASSSNHHEHDFLSTPPSLVSCLLFDLFFG
ncbi:hypothetical protein JHK82_034777 [Glycine max]|nr:hypothetical protein JHK82_034777 [Glycine max]